MSIDLTLMDVGQEKGCIRVIKKPNFVYADFDLQANKCLLYIANTQQCWKNGEFDGTKLTINVQIPRAVNAGQANSKLVSCSLNGQGHTGIYHAQIKHFFAIQLRGPFHIQDPVALEPRIQGRAGDWLVSDGNMNKVITDDMMRRNFALDKAYDYQVGNVKPRWRRDKYGLPEHDFTCFTPGL